MLSGPDNVPRHGPKETNECASTAAIDRYLGEKDAWKMFLVEDADKKESAKHAASLAPKQADDLLAEMSSDMEAHQGMLFVLMQSHTDPGCDFREPQAWLRVMLMAFCIRCRNCCSKQSTLG